MPAGASSSLIPATEAALDTPMDYESVPALGAQLGSASVIILDETVNISDLVNSTVHFFKHESCGKCTPCREGTYWMAHITDRIAHGTGQKRRYRPAQDGGQPDAEQMLLCAWVNSRSWPCCLAFNISGLISKPAWRISGWIN